MEASQQSSLRRFNAVMAGVHALQAAAMVAISNDFSLPVTATFLTGPPGSGAVEPDVLFDVRLGPAVAAFLAISAVFHLVVVLPWGNARYVAEIDAGRNRFRWVEYSLSASLMIVLIAMITGISDVAALTALFGVNASMILFGWLMETTNDRRGSGVGWAPFVMGSLAGVVPWLAIGVYLWSPGQSASPPAFVYGIFVTIFVLFNCFAVNQLLQYRSRGRWERYVFGERVYVWLSLVAKSLLAWQIFVNTLID